MRSRQASVTTVLVVALVGLPSGSRALAQPAGVAAPASVRAPDDRDVAASPGVTWQEAARLPDARLAPSPRNTPGAVPLAIATSAAAVAAGGSHTCALTSGGGVQCWGRNNYGQLGDGTTGNRSTPVAVSGLTSGVTAVAIGYFHTCAVTSGGGVKCWGYNGLGQLGDGTYTSRSTPVNVSGLTSGVTVVAADGYHTCAVTSGGGVKCWGYNYYGQLGDSTTMNRSTPVAVSGLTSGVTAVAIGYSHTCAVTSGGGVQCWGYNSYGQLGDATTTDRSTPGDVSGLTSGVTSVAAGDNHTCAVTSGGGVQCWGDNVNGQIGDGTSGPLTPVDVSGLTSAVTAVAAGSNHACAVTSGGGLKCWGYNSFRQLGDGTTTDRSTPVDVSGLTSGVTSVAAGRYHTCAVTSGGGAKCWGYNSYGQLGDGTFTNRSTPVAVSGLTSGVTSVTAGYAHTCAVTAGGGVKCWGYNYYGQLGDGTTTTRSTPVDVSGLTSGVSAVAAGNYHTCALISGGGVKCWGYNYYGQLGDGTTTNRSTPVAVSGLTSGVTSVAAGDNHTCAVTSGGLKCWGYNGNGQLGDGTSTQRPTPVDVSGLTSGITAAAAGNDYTCAVTSGGGAKCWGYNYYGQLGDGTTTSRSTPVNVSGLTSGVTAVAAGDSLTCAVASGGVKCWGRNDYGQAGNGTTTRRLRPVGVVGFTVGSAFTDDPLTAGATVIKAVHLTELRTRIDATRIRYGLAAYGWTSATLTAGTSVITAAHVTELRTAVGAVYDLAGRARPTYTDATLTAGVTAVKAAHLTEVRNALLAVE